MMTPAEHRELAESHLRQLQSLGPGSLAYHGLAISATAHVLAAIAGYLEPPPEPDIPGLPLGWRITTRQSEIGELKWAYILTRPDHNPIVSRYQFGSSGTALIAGLRAAEEIQEPPELYDPPMYKDETGGAHHD